MAFGFGARGGNDETVNAGMWVGVASGIIAVLLGVLTARESEEEAGQAMPVAPIVFYLIRGREKRARTCHGVTDSRCGHRVPPRQPVPVCVCAAHARPGGPRYVKCEQSEEMAMLSGEQNGLWYDPSQSGQGFQIQIDAAGRHMSEFYCGAVPNWFPGHPVWLSIQGQPDANGKLPLLVTLGTLGTPGKLDVRQVGYVTLTLIDDRIAATVTINGNGRAQFSPVPPPLTVSFSLQRWLG
ncbi:MAG TPA: hypothetical protein VFG73_02330 [Rhodanobacteraceae bacterium]|nr:hypothetical protein [Rhodanobacteraceae bacterium]